jgi:hypothetical protein
MIVSSSEAGALREREEGQQHCHRLDRLSHRESRGALPPGFRGLLPTTCRLFLRFLPACRLDALSPS